MGSRHEPAASEFAYFVKGLGFRVFLAKTRDYGFITDADGSRVLSFSFTDGSRLSGNYWPPSQQSGTGWRMEISPHALRNAEDVRNALCARPPDWCGKGWKRYTTLADHLGMYGSSSGYVEI